MQRWAQKRTEKVRTQQKQKILRRGGKNTKEDYTKKYLVVPDNHDGVITQLKPDILEWRVKWVLGRIITNKASGADKIPGELFHILKDGAVKVLHSTCQRIWKTQQWPHDWKMSIFTQYASKFGKLSSGHTTGKCPFSFQSQRKAMLKNVQIIAQLHSSPTLAK